LDSVRIRYADPEAIRDAVARYAASLRASAPQVKSIRWFGSWVTGTAGVGSDVDLCIVVSPTAVPRRDRLPDYMPQTFPVGLDLIVVTEQELETLRAEHPSLAQAMDSGIEM
jgi:predicted nucleotidyltransferase